MAVLVRLPVAVGSMGAVTVYVTVPPTGMKVTVSLMSPLPDGSLPVTPAEPTLVQVTPVSAAGKGSVTTASVAALGPLLVTTIVYVTAVPGTAEVTPSVLVMDRSACCGGLRVGRSPGCCPSAGRTGRCG